MTVSPSGTQTLTQALKEWQVAVTALTAGETIVLLRKGGIREAKGGFMVRHDRALLYPTYEHQKPHLLKPAYARRVEPVVSGWHPDTVEIAAWVKITDQLELVDQARLQALLPFHIWNQEFAVERLKWQPQQPLTVLLLRVYRLSSPLLMLFDPAYGGCKSWIEIPPIAVDEALPALSDRAYDERVASIRAILAD